MWDWWATKKQTQYGRQPKQTVSPNQQRIAKCKLSHTCVLLAVVIIFFYYFYYDFYFSFFRCDHRFSEFFFHFRDARTKYIVAKYQKKLFMDPVALEREKQEQGQWCRERRGWERGEPNTDLIQHCRAYQVQRDDAETPIWRLGIPSNCQENSWCTCKSTRHAN